MEMLRTAVPFEFVGSSLFFHGAPVQTIRATVSAPAAAQQKWVEHSSCSKVCPAVVVAAFTLSARVRYQVRRLPRSGAIRSTAQDLASAVSEGRMISLEEVAARKALGAFFAVLFAWQAWLVYTTGATTLPILGSPYAVLAVLASNAAGFYGSGQIAV